jgi:hypothetical protein
MTKANTKLAMGLVTAPSLLVLLFWPLMVWLGGQGWVPTWAAVPWMLVCLGGIPLALIFGLFGLMFAFQGGPLGTLRPLFVTIHAGAIAIGIYGLTKVMELLTAFRIELH